LRPHRDHRGCDRLPKIKRRFEFSTEGAAERAAFHQRVLDSLIKLALRGASSQGVGA
jgi:hypothetical protein